MRGRSPCPQIHCAALSHLHTSLLSHRVLPRAMRCINSSLSNSSFLSTALSRLPTLKKLKFNTSGTQVVDLIGNGCPIADYKAGLERFSGVGSANSKAAKRDF